MPFGPPRAEKYLQLQLTMNQENASGRELPQLLTLIHLRDLYSIVSYLDDDCISALLQALPSTRNAKFLQVLKVTHFLRQYLIRADRSLYMPFYAEDSFKRIENQLLRGICGHAAPTLAYYLAAYQHITARIRQEFIDLPQGEDLVTELISILVDPELPFPKLRKQTIGSHCNSAFQYYLVDKLFSPQDEEDPGENFTALKQFLEQRQDNPQSKSNAEDQPVYCSVLCEWFKITFQNFQESILPGRGRAGHNLIVLIVALVDLVMDSTRFYIEGIKDPLHRFVEFNLRYCMLRNSILALQERLSFLFQGYSQDCRRVLQRQPEVRQMSIWHVMLSKWYLHMHRHHCQLFRMFFYLLRKVNLTTIQQEIDCHLDEDQAYIELKNRLELSDIDLLEREECFELYSPLEGYFQDDGGLYKQLIQEYMEYKIDLSVNQYSVHWCGFSEQELHIPYKDFQGLFLPQFADYLRRLLQVAKGVPHAGLAIDRALCAMLEQIDCDFLKPVTLKKILSLLKTEANGILGACYPDSCLAKKILQTENYFTISDKKLALCNQQHNISNQNAVKFSIIVENEDFNKMLKDSASTAHSKNCNNPKFLAEYHHLEEEYVDQEEFY